jgi:hypothetical protein
MAMQYINTGKGGRLLVVENYLFRVDKQVNLVNYWKCMGRDQYGCRATAKTNGENLETVSAVESHTHADDSAEIKRKEFKIEIEQKVSVLNAV